MDGVGEPLARVVEAVAQLAEVGGLAGDGLDGVDGLAGGVDELEGEPLAGLGVGAAVDGLVDADRGLAGGGVGVREGHLELTGGY